MGVVGVLANPIRRREQSHPHASRCEAPTFSPLGRPNPTPPIWRRRGNALERPQREKRLGTREAVSCEVEGDVAEAKGGEPGEEFLAGGKESRKVFGGDLDARQVAMDT